MSNAYNIFTGNALDPRESVFEVYTAISHGLQNATKTMSEEAKALYLKENPHRHNMGWNNSLVFDKDEITDITAKDDCFTIEFGKSKPCGRGCCSDWISDTMIFPDHLVTAFEATQVGVYAEQYFEDDEANTAYSTAIKAHVQALCDVLERRIFAEKAETARKAEQARAATQGRREREVAEKEERDRAEFERLKTKYEGAE